MGTIQPVTANFDLNHGIKSPSGWHTSVSGKADRDTVLKELKTSSVFSVDDTRKRSFCKVKTSLLHKKSSWQNTNNGFKNA